MLKILVISYSLHKKTYYVSKFNFLILKDYNSVKFR